MEEPACPWDGECVDSGDEVGVCCGWGGVDPADDGGVCCGLPGEAQFLITGLVPIGDCSVLRWMGLGLFSMESHDETKHFRRLTNCLIVLIKYIRAATAIREIPEKVRNNTNHICASLVSSWTCFSVDMVKSPLQPSMAVSKASSHTR